MISISINRAIRMVAMKWRYATICRRSAVNKKRPFILRLAKPALSYLLFRQHFIYIQYLYIRMSYVLLHLNNSCVLRRVSKKPIYSNISEELQPNLHNYNNNYKHFHKYIKKIFLIILCLEFCILLEFWYSG